MAHLADEEIAERERPESLVANFCTSEFYRDLVGQRTHAAIVAAIPASATVDWQDIANEIADYAVGERHNRGMHARVSDYALDLITRKLVARAALTKGERR